MTRLKQSRRMSAVESVANIAVGYWIAVLTQIVVFPMFGMAVAPEEHLAIGAIFTAVSLVRSYALRRAFEML